MIYYFTGTGNSLWAARRLGKALEQPVSDIAGLLGQDKIIADDKTVGFVFPTYMNDIPWIVKSFLLKLHIKSDCYCFAVMTSNNGKSGNSAHNIDKALNTNGAKLSACFDLQMPGNCIESSDSANRQRLELAPSRLEEIISQLKEKAVNFVSDGKSAGEDFVKSSFFYGTKSLKRLTVMNEFCITDECTGCGICEKICPTHNITIKDKKAIHSDNCAACYRCLHWCPVHATLPKFFFIKHRKQYTHPEISLADIVASANK